MRSGRLLAKLNQPQVMDVFRLSHEAATGEPFTVGMLTPPSRSMAADTPPLEG